VTLAATSWRDTAAVCSVVMLKYGPALAVRAVHSTERGGGHHVRHDVAKSPNRDRCQDSSRRLRESLFRSVCWSPGLFFDPDHDGCSLFPRNVGVLLSDYGALKSQQSPLRKSQVQHAYTQFASRLMSRQDSLYHTCFFLEINESKNLLSRVLAVSLYHGMCHVFL
jgi:hypothetical protein